MGSNQKQTQMGQKADFERRLEVRLSFLSKKGIESPEIKKDTLVKKLRANIKSINSRLRTIAGIEKKTEELAKAKVEKAAAKLKEHEGGKSKQKKEAPPPEEVKEKKKKKVKETKEAAADQPKEKE